MDTTLTTNNKEYNNGYKLLKTNPFFNDLISLMKNSEFNAFYDNYFHDWTDIQTMIFYMKLHHTIKYEYNERYGHNISDELMVHSLHEIMTNAQTRKTAMQLFNDFKLDHDASKSFRTLLPLTTNKQFLCIKDSTK